MRDPNNINPATDTSRSDRAHVADLDDVKRRTAKARALLDELLTELEIIDETITRHGEIAEFVNARGIEQISVGEVIGTLEVAKDCDIGGIW